MTYINENEGTCASITETSKGFVVCFMDTEAENGIVATRIYDNLKDADRYARHIVYGFLFD